MDFKLWLEVKYSADLVQQIKDKLATDQSASVWLDAEGNVQMDWPFRPDNMSYSRYNKSHDNKIFITPDDKTIMFDMIGDKVKSAHKKLIKFLVSNGIIDDTWTVKGGREIGEYLDFKYTYFTDPDMPKTVRDVDKLQTISPAMENITLYHGTSEDDWEKIQKAGALYPLFMGSNKEHGYESRAKHPYNKDLLYLATNARKAWDYALMRAKGGNRRLDPKLWSSMQHSDKQRWTIRPVLLRVTVPDITRLRADDDVVNAKMRNIADKLWNKKSPEEQQQIMIDLSQQRGFVVKDPSIADMLWRETDDAWPQILAKLNPKIYRAWLASILRTEQVSYKGFIPLRFIKEVPIFPRQEPTD